MEIFFSFPMRCRLSGPIKINWIYNRSIKIDQSKLSLLKRDAYSVLSNLAFPGRLKGG